MTSGYSRLILLYWPQRVSVSRATLRYTPARARARAPTRRLFEHEHEHEHEHENVPYSVISPIKPQVCAETARTATIWPTSSGRAGKLTVLWVRVRPVNWPGSSSVGPSTSTSKVRPNSAS